MKTPLDILHKHFHHFNSERTRDVVVKAMSEYATLYANEKLKGMLEVAKQEAAKWQTKSDKENDISNKAAYSMTAYAVNRIATHEPTKPII